ncbi:MAG: hypothetical protein JWM11_3563 [Planctomycetaceae bacterium]|nr:hypothetical protein [Planctomycetaceae bacterium]
MSAMIDAPVDLLEAIAHLRLPPHADRQLQDLMDANTNGVLTDSERDDLAALVEWSESVSLLRAQALHLLGEQPESAAFEIPLLRLAT